MKIVFELTVQEANLVIMGLQELPAKESMNLILRLDAEGKKQFEEQTKPPMEVKKPFDSGNTDTGI